MDKKTGYLLLLSGVGLLFCSTALILLLLFGKFQVPQPFNMDTSVKVTLSTGGTADVPLPPQVNQAANFSIFFVGMIFLAGIGVRISRLGISLIQGSGLSKEGKS